MCNVPRSIGILPACVNPCSCGTRQCQPQPKLSECRDCSWRTKRGRDSARSGPRGTRCSTTGDELGAWLICSERMYVLLSSHVDEEDPLDVCNLTCAPGIPCQPVARTCGPVRRQRAFLVYRVFFTLTTQLMANGSPKILPELWPLFRCGFSRTWGVAAR